MAEILTVLTFKSARHIVGDGGTQSWIISPRRAGRCAYVVCVRHQQGPYKAEGTEPHKHAFLVGKVSGVVPSSEASDRFRVKMSEYAILAGPHIPLNSASPTQYFPSLSSVGIDERSLHWKPIHVLPDEDGSIPRGGVSPAGGIGFYGLNVEKDDVNRGNDETARRRAAIQAMLQERDDGTRKKVTLEEVLAWRHEGHRY
jgi:hypothetical protein